MRAWPIPTELVEELATSTGSVLLMRARMSGAVTTAEAYVSVRAGRYVAEIGFTDPVGLDGQRGLAVMLRVPVGGLSAARERRACA